VTRSVAARWLLLATLWSLQHLFLRMAVPVFGTALVAEARAFFAGCFLLTWLWLVMRESLHMGSHWRDHLAVSVTNNVLPFLCFAYAATALPASYLAVMNGMVPLWSAIVAAPVLGEPLGARRIAGFLLGLFGVALIVNLGPVPIDVTMMLALLAGMIGSALWGWAGIIIRQRSDRLPPMSLATGSILFSTILLSPAWASVPPVETWTPSATVALIGGGLLCTGLAYLPFFTLVRDIGPTPTLSVGLAVPVLGMLWGWLFLGEVITLGMLAGAALVLVALVLVMAPRR
jgi:drug/metabolite transporter (DMT)-like permease